MEFGRLGKVNGWLVVGVKADYHTRDLGLWVGCPPWGVFLRFKVGNFVHSISSSALMKSNCISFFLDKNFELFFDKNVFNVSKSIVLFLPIIKRIKSQKIKIKT